MPVLNSIADRLPYFAAFRQKLHENPELAFATEKTAAFVVEELQKMGIEEIHTGIAQNGVIAIIRGKSDGKTIGLRADMDALPIHEKTGKAYASKVDGAMHACGHDGHTATLLAAAEHLSQNRNFDGNIALIFQPAEEDGAGANVMVQEGVLEKFNISEVYAYHNHPGEALGEFSITEGPIMAAASTFEITVKGKGGHAAFPETCLDPIPIAMRVVDAIYTIKSRALSAFEPAVISVTQFNAGSAENIVPDEVKLVGTIRTLSTEVQKFIFEEMTKIVTQLPQALGATAEIDIDPGYPATVNHAGKTQIAIKAAKKIVGNDQVTSDINPVLGAEDFAYFLEKIPGAYGFFGAGEGADLHNAAFDFNDELIPIAASWFVEVANSAFASQ